MNAQEVKLGKLYNAMRERLVNRYFASFNSIGADAEEAVASAFEYAAKLLLGREGDFKEKDLEKLICNKTNLLFKDAIVTSKRERGRRSVKAATSLDDLPDEDDDYRASPIDKYSLKEYFENTTNNGDENLALLRAKAIDCVLMKRGVSARDRDIYDRCLWRASDRKALAAEMRTTVSNIGRIKCECNKMAMAFAPEIRFCYASLVRRYERMWC